MMSPRQTMTGFFVLATLTDGADVSAGCAMANETVDREKTMTKAK
jgi:hypothetical protein